MNSGTSRRIPRKNQLPPRNQDVYDYENELNSAHESLTVYFEELASKALNIIQKHSTVYRISQANSIGSDSDSDHHHAKMKKTKKKSK